MNGLALAMQIKLAQLRHPRGAPEIVPLLPPAPGPMIFEGVAGAITVDRELTKFRPWSFALPWMLRQPLPPLLWRHGEPAGRIEALDHDERGQLTIRAFVTHPLALRASHFSICASIGAFEMTADHALVTACTIVEISLTDRPCNSDAKVLRRYPAVDYGGVIERLQRLTQLIKEQPCLR